MIKKIIMLLTVLTVGLLSSCRTAPIYSVQNQIISPFTYQHKTPTLAQVEAAISNAAIGLGWTVNQVKPGLIYATLDLRNTTAVVSIPYTVKYYTIMYKSSQNLSYDGTTIHKNYNGWVMNLDKAIRQNLQKIKV